MDVVQHFRLTQDPFKAGVQRELDGEGATLEFEAARRFIATRTAVAGRGDLFSPAALDVLAAAARGRPAALRLLAGNAMFHAAFDGANRIEEAHARQAVATQDIWRDVPAPEAPTAAAPVAEAAAPIAVAPLMSRRADPAPASIIPAATLPPRVNDADSEDVTPPRRGWWGSVPPLARLAMVVGLLLLSLPVIGYVVGAVKDERPAPDSSYLPDEDATAAAGAVADAEASIETPPQLPPVAVPAPVDVAEAEPAGNLPRDLTAQTAAADPASAPADDPVAVGAGQSAPAPAPVVDDPPAPEPEPEGEVQPAPEPAPAAVPDPAPVPASDAPRVFVHYSTSQSEGADTAANIARRLRSQGFEVVDIRAVPMSIETASVRYFFPADRAAAEALHDALGRALRPRGYSAGDLKSMTGYDPAPRRGTLEVWVPAG